MANVDAGPSPAVKAALDTLGVRRLVLAIHDASLPGGNDDIGRGAPASPEALELFAFARELGFDSLQLGPQGLTGPDDESPYMGALFSRNPLSISLERLARATGPSGAPSESDDAEDWGELLPAPRLATLAAARPPGAEHRVPYASVYRAHRSALGIAFERFEKQRAAGDARAVRLDAALGQFGQEAGPWLESDALYEALRGEHGGRDWPHWTGPRAELDRAVGLAARNDAAVLARRAELARRHAPALRFYHFVQLLAHVQHAQFRRAVHGLGLEIYADLQVGVSPRDSWRHADAFLDGYRLGAPPSRTNPDGQPWDYPVLDPAAYRSHDGKGDGPVLRFLTERIRKTFAEYDAVRVDHPQGLVCPWVYRADGPDPLAAVQGGARLFSSPDLPDHPELARHALVRREDLTRDASLPRHADGWVARLSPEQVDRYAVLFDRVVELARAHARAEPALVCEILSTLPNPLAKVLARHGLGRFRVTQKADPTDPHDVYRADNARPEDWIMFGNHDTPPLWHLLEQWQVDGRAAGRAAYAAACLSPSTKEREALEARLRAAPGLLAHAEIAQLFASPARHVAIFFADLFGLNEIYNRPGTVSHDNWSLRLEPEWRARYEQRLRGDRALNLPLALWLALRASGEGAPTELLAELRREAERRRGGVDLLDGTQSE